MSSRLLECDLKALLFVAWLASALGCADNSHEMAIKQIESMGGSVEERPNGEIWVRGLGGGKGRVWTDADFARVFPSMLQLRRIDHLELSACLISDPTLELVGRFTDLKVFWMQAPSKEISEVGLSHLMRLRKLKELYVAGLRDARWTCFERIHDLGSLENLHIIMSAVDDDTVKFLAKHPTLKNVHIGGARMSNASACVFASMPALEVLTSFESLEDSGLLTLADTPRLMKVDVMHTKVTRAGIVEFKRRRPNVEVVE